jgi:hypothetical protein
MIRIDVLQDKTNNGENTKNYENHVPISNTTPNLTDTSKTFDGDLWARIQAFTFDLPDARLTFAIRLARETGWTAAFTAQAIQEYRRFLYLAVRAGHPVTPSQDVDEVWHLHLMYTRHYWGVLCRDVLQTDLHHGPSLGGASEHAKYHDLYGRTLSSYARIFRETPPAELWPTPEQRFRPKPRVGAVDPATHWIIRKPAWLTFNWPKLIRNSNDTDRNAPLSPPFPPSPLVGEGRGGGYGEGVRGGKAPPNLALPRSIFVNYKNRGSTVLPRKGGGGERAERSEFCINIFRGLALICLTIVALGGLPMASSWAASAGRQTETYGPAIILSLLGAYGLFKVVRFLTETPADRTARKARDAERRQNGGSMSSGGCGGDGGSGCGGGCGGCS